MVLAIWKNGSNDCQRGHLVALIAIVIVFSALVIIIFVTWVMQRAWKN